MLCELWRTWLPPVVQEVWLYSQNLLLCKVLSPVVYVEYFVCAFRCNSEVIFIDAINLMTYRSMMLGLRLNTQCKKTWPKWWSEHEVINTHYWDIPVHQSKLKGNTFCCQNVFKTKEMHILFDTLMMRGAIICLRHSTG